VTCHTKSSPGAGGVGSHRCYAQWRARQIAYGRWAPWVQASAVRAHLQVLRQAGASYRAIARAAGVSPATVHRLQHSQRACETDLPDRVRAAQARRLLAVTPDAVLGAAPRRTAAGTRRRLQALIAIGYPPATLAALAGVAPRMVWRIVRADTTTVSGDLHETVRGLYDRIWDVPPAGQTAARQRSAAAARSMAAAHGWPAPMGLDDDRIDNPSYQPRAHWRPVTGPVLANGGLARLPCAPADGKGRRGLDGPGVKGRGLDSVDGVVNVHRSRCLTSGQPLRRKTL
jgi:hypothetical protein